MSDMPKAYEPQGVEDSLYQLWMESEFFNPDKLPDLDEREEVFSIVLPPPNVTGTLHMGHATMLAIQDAMIRFARLNGKRTLWLPGTDHAAIATQSKVEKMIFEKEKKSRHDLGREEFLQRVNQFAQDSHDTIVNQVKKMGSSVDWSREAYTLDAERNRAVNEAFKRMYDDGLIYRGDRIVNWDPKGQTTISDDELVYKEEKTTFYYFKYGPFVIGTARPETKFGDKYVVMHPKDQRYADYKHGQTLELEWINGPITATVIKDESIDMDFGTGVMTITPWHSAVDFEIAQRHNLDKEQIIDEQGRLLPIAGEFAGMGIEEARGQIVEKLRSKGLLEKEEDYTHNVATAERTGGMIEPQIKLQWFIDVNKEFKKNGQVVTLKSLMQQAVRGGDIEIIPERFEKTYFHWIDNLRDWNISRQLWFGHRVPVWYKGDDLAVGEAPAGEGWTQDEDTLDTWFSSGLWTFSTLGWPDATEDLKLYHPTTVLETGYDILFFWVARMILMSTYLMDEVPFKYVYLHGLVRDEKGRKMSKSLGNIIDPLDMIEKYGADATRLSLVIGSTPGNDVKLSEEKIAGFRNFTNKLWNIARFVLGKVETVEHIDDVSPKTLADRWILGRFAEVVTKVTKLHESFDLSLAGEVLRDFTWSDFADWYLEIAKIEGEKDDILNYVLERLLILWHPFMPFVTEEIYKQYDRGLILVAKWPQVTGELSAEDAKSLQKLQSIITDIREFKTATQLNSVDVKILGGSSFVESQAEVIKRLAKVDNLVVGAAEGDDDLAAIAVTFNLPEDFDATSRIEKLNKEIVSVKSYIESVTTKLSNQDFVANAPVSVIEAEKTKLTEAQGRLQAFEKQLNLLKP